MKHKRHNVSFVGISHLIYNFESFCEEGWIINVIETFIFRNDIDTD